VSHDPTNGAKGPPGALPDSGILLGYSLEHERREAPIGFQYGSDAESEPARPEPPAGAPTLDPILHTASGHLLTIAPTGSGKGVGCIVPTLLRYPGPVIVIDPKGENYAVTAERRRALGQRVVVLDPMGITDADDPGALNPLDLVDPESEHAIDDAAALASLLSGGVEREDPRNLFWYQRGAQLLTGVIQYVAVDAPPSRRNLAEVRRLLNLPADDFAAIASTQMTKSSDPDVRQVAGTLANPASEMIGSILAMSQNSLGFLRGRLLADATSTSSFDLEDVTAGEPLSIYLVIPPDKLESHRNLLRLWIGVLMSALMRRRAPVPRSTLLILDEAAQLGPLEQLRQAITLMRGYGVQTWSFWQDVSQLENLYPLDWETMYNNCHVHQAFGFATLKAAQDTCDLLGFHDALEVLKLDSDEMILSISGDEAVIAQKPNYLTDPAFDGLFAPNPFYARSSDARPSRQRKPRVYVRPAHPTPAERGVVDEVAALVPPDEDDDEDDDILPDPSALFGSTVTNPASDPDDDDDARTGRRESLMDPLPDVIIDFPRGVPVFVDLVVDQLGGAWNLVTTELRGVAPDCYPDGHIVELYDSRREPSRALVFKKDSEVRSFEGTADQFDWLNRDVPLALDASNVAEYVRLRLHFQRAGGGPQVADDLERLRAWTGGSEPELARFETRLEALGAQARDEGGWTVTGTAVAEGALVRIRVPVEEDGTLGRIDCEFVADLDLGRDYPAIGPAGDPTPPDLRQRLARLHGNWQVVDAVDVDVIHGDFPYALGAPEDQPVFRRALACYPGRDLVRMPHDLLAHWSFLLHRPGEARPAARGQGGTVISRFNPGALVLDTEVQAEEYLRFFTWFVGSSEHPWLLLDDPAAVPIDADASKVAIPPNDWAGRWVAPTSVPLRDDDPETARWRFRATLLSGARVITAEFLVEESGGVEMTDSEELTEDLSLDRRLLERMIEFPPLGPRRPPRGEGIGVGTGRGEAP
jgi:type IV secretion system protein VirD4